MLFALLLPLLVGEVAVRLFSEYGYSTPSVERKRVFAYDASIFCRNVLRPEARVVHEGPLDYPVNSLGYRGEEFSFQKPSNTVRIIMYGGSVVLDLASSGYSDWPARVEQILHSNGWVQAEVINAGVAGHASFDSLGRLYAEGHLLDPDYVLLCNAWNDIKYFRFEQPILRIFLPYREDPRLVYHGPLDWILCNVSQLYVRLRNRYLSWRHRAGVEGRLPEESGPARIEENALRQYRLNLELFVDAVRNMGATPVLMTQARLATFENASASHDKIPYGYTLFDHQTLCEAFEHTDRIVRQVGEKKRVEVVDASAEMTGSTNFLYDHVHTTDAGSQKLADLVASCLLDLFSREGCTGRTTVASP